jgi:hypothetical protein
MPLFASPATSASSSGHRSAGCSSLLAAGRRSWLGSPVLVAWPSSRRCASYQRSGCGRRCTLVSGRICRGSSATFGIVALFQLRLTRAVENASEATKLALAMPLMGFSFLLLVVNGSLAMLVVVTIVFVVGEMLWIPTSQSLAARLAPEPIRDAYMGAFTASAGAAWTIGPLVALEIRSVAGNTPVWLAFAAASIAGALAGTLASRAPPALDESVLAPRTNLHEAVERP